MFRALALATALALLPAALAADTRPTVRESLEAAIAAWEGGDTAVALRHIRSARHEILERDEVVPAGVRSNLAELEQALAMYRLYAGGRRADLDAAHDAVMNTIGNLRIGYAERRRSVTHRTRLADFDLDGRIRRIGEMDIDYVPFEDKIRTIGSIRIEYVPFSERPRRIGPIDYHWFFDDLFSVAGEHVNRY